MYTKIKTVEYENNKVIANPYRAQLKNQMDNFTSFQWGTHDMYDEFGMFIINEKQGGLKMYNGPSFSNQYTKAQFSSEGNFLSGINFNIQTIEFTVGMYYFTIAEYRQMLKILSPYEVNDLSFDFNPEWHYQVKLKNIADSPKYIVGQQMTTGFQADVTKESKTFNEYYYYTELKLSFEIQGTPCLYAQPYEWEETNTDAQTQATKSIQKLKSIPDNYHEADLTIRSDLDFPFDIIIPFKPTVAEGPVKIAIKYQKQNMTPELLMTCTLANLTQITVEEKDPDIEKVVTQLADTFWIHYYSDTGIVLYNIGNSTDTLLTLMSSGSNGKRLVEQLETHKFMFAKDEDLSDNSIIIELTNATLDMSSDGINNIPNFKINSMARTNIA